MSKDFPDFFDYLDWRGDLDFAKSPFNAVDALILCQISYLALDSVVPKAAGSAIFMRDAAAFRPNLKSPGLVINERTADLFFRAAKTARFGGVMMCDYAEKYDEAREEQFAALTFVLDKKTQFVAFRGTDDTITGWKEDFNLAFLNDIPAQKDALEYLTESASGKYRVIVGGHSKGGNLAIYAAANCVKYRKNIDGVYNFDGPGFSADTLKSAEFREIEAITHSFYPQMSIIGQLFEHFERYTVVKSNAQFLMQHDPFSWKIRARDFEEQSALDSASEYFHKTFCEWFVALEKDKREQFVNALFAPISQSDFKNLSALSANWLDAAAFMFRSASEMDSEVKNEAWKTLSSFFSVAQKNFGALISQK